MILPENRFPVFGIMRHCHARPGAKPLEPFGKGSNALKAGTPDAGPESPTVQKRDLRGRPFSPRPGSSGNGPYTRPIWKGKAAPDSIQQSKPGPLCCLAADRDRLDISGLAVFFAPALRAS